MSIRRILNILPTILALLCLFLEHSSAETHYVSHGGSDTPPYTSWETAATSIQAAIDASSEGDTVLIAPGMFAGGVILKTGISLSGSGADDTEISCGLDPVLTCQDVREASIRNLKIFSGYVSKANGAGIYVVGCSELTIGNCTFIKNRTYYGSGAGLAIEDSQGIVVADCVFQDNECEYGFGGAIYASRSSVDILGSRIEGNRAEEGGGGIFLGSSGKVCRIAHCEIVANVAPYGYGGGLACYSQGEISDCVVANNSAQGDGGGIWCGETLRIQGCIICNNRAESSSLREGRGGGIYCRGIPGGSIVNCVVASNWSKAWNAEGIYWEANANVVNCTIVQNSDPNRKYCAGLGVAFPAETHGTYENITNCVFLRNQVYGCRATYSALPWRSAEEGEGNIEDAPHIRVYATCEVESVLYDHLEATTTVTCKEPVGDDNLYRHMFVQSPPYGPSFLIASNSGNELLCYGSIPGDLVGTTLEITDFSLSEDSPCIDAGNNDADYLPETDKAGAFRIYRGRDEWRVDMGAYEYGSRRFRISSIQPTAEPPHLKITWNSQFLPSKSYSIYFSPDLLTWTLAGSNIPSQGAATTWIDPAAGAFGSRFYTISSP